MAKVNSLFQDEQERKVAEWLKANPGKTEEDAYFALNQERENTMTDIAKAGLTREWLEELMEAIKQADDYGVLDKRELSDLKALALSALSPMPVEAGELCKRLNEETLPAIQRLISGAFRRDGEVLEYGKRPNFSIPCLPNFDDDCLAINGMQDASDLIQRLSSTQSAQADMVMVPRPISEAPEPQPDKMDDQLLVIRHDGKIELRQNDKNWWLNLIKDSDTKKGDHIGHLPQYFITLDEIRAACTAPPQPVQPTYREGLEAAAKVAEEYNMDGADKISTIARQVNIVAAIRAPISVVSPGGQK